MLTDLLLQQEGSSNGMDTGMREERCDGEEMMCEDAVLLSDLPLLVEEEWSKLREEYMNCLPRPEDGERLCESGMFSDEVLSRDHYIDVMTYLEEALYAPIREQGTCWYRGNITACCDFVSML